MDKIKKFIGNKVAHSNENLYNVYTGNEQGKESVILIYGDNELTKLLKAYCDSQKYI